VINPLRVKNQYGFGYGAMLLDPAQGRNLNGWQRIWIFGSVIWAALIFIIADP
jgi:hypothetical protein